KRRQIQIRGKGINHNGFVGSRHLGDTQERIVGRFSQKFGIGGDEGVARPSLACRRASGCCWAQIHCNLLAESAGRVAGGKRKLTCGLSLRSRTNLPTGKSNWDYAASGLYQVISLLLVERLRLRE